MNLEFKTKGVCARQINLEIEDGIVKDVKFIGGCNGNSSGISMLVKDMKVEDVIKKLKGIKCGFKNTSCPDQLAIALEKLLTKKIYNR